MTVCSITMSPGPLFVIVEVVFIFLISWILLYKPFKNKQKHAWVFIPIFIGFLLLGSFFIFAFTAQSRDSCEGLSDPVLVNDYGDIDSKESAMNIFQNYAKEEYAFYNDSQIIERISDAVEKNNSYEIVFGRDRLTLYKNGTLYKSWIGD